MLEKAPDIDFIISEESILRLNLFSSLNENFYKVDSDYLYWDKVKYLNKQKDLLDEKYEFIDPKEIWKYIKFKRKINNKNVIISDIGYKFNVFNYNINEYLQQKLHYLDFNFGAGIQKEQLLSDLDPKVIENELYYSQNLNQSEQQQLNHLLEKYRTFTT